MIAFEYRGPASVAYRHYRRTWSHEASVCLTNLRYATEPSVRLAAALTLAKFGIPRDGVYHEVRK